MHTIRVGNQSVKLGQRIGKGGEGEVFEVNGQPDQVIKLYDAKLRRQREGKVRAMVSALLADSTDLVAFPREIASDPAGHFLGFAMRFVRGYKPIHELYSPKSRKRNFPRADYRFIISAALNVARAVGKVHETGCVIGDLNHSGVLVSHNSTIALIDADSFQFATNGKSYPCVVGVPDFTPPELHGARLSEVTRTTAHDSFGLAVLIFHLLAMGRHPYAGRYSGGELGLSEAIEQNRFAFSILRKSETRTTPPPASVTLGDFPPRLAQLFEAAFGLRPSERPSAAQWITALKELENSISRCASVPTHYYPSKSGSCLWCRLAAESGVDMFPQSFDASAPIGSVGSFDIQQILNIFIALRMPTETDLLPKWSGSISGVSGAVSAAKNGSGSKKALGGAILLGAILAFFAFPPAFLVWLIAGGLGASLLFMSDSVDKSPFLASHAQAETKVKELEQAHLKRLGLSEFQTLRSDLDQWINLYRGLDLDLNNRLAKLKADREQRQREEFLDRFDIRRASISGIGVAKKAMLASYGIETAADVNAHAVRAVPGFGEAMTAKMMSWRKTHETRFRYNPVPDASDIQAERTVRAEWAKRRTDLQAKIRSALSSLQTAPKLLVERSARIDPALLRALEARAKAEHDLQSLGIAVPVRIQNLYSTPSSTRTSPPPVPASGNPTCPKCGSAMRRRMARRGRNRGHQFWGCSRYPTCNGTRS